jgi:hypothetical protein
MPEGVTLGQLTRRRDQVATHEYVRRVAADLDLCRDEAERVADYIAREIERVGGSDARLVLIVDGLGNPHCSWCWALMGLCPHIAGGQSEHYATKAPEVQR